MNSSTATAHINLDYLRLMADGDTDMERVIINMLIDEIPVEFGRMKTAWESGNMDDLSFVSHKMKSTLAFIGNPELTTANATLNEIAKANGSAAAVSDCMAVLERWFPIVLDELKGCAS